MDKKAINKLNNRKTIDAISKAIHDIIFYDLISDAKKMIEALEDVFSKNSNFSKDSHELFVLYDNFLTILKFVIIFDLEDDEVFNLIKNKLDLILKYSEYDLDSKIRYKIRSIVGAKERDVFKDRIKQSLIECKTRIGNKKITFNNEVHSPSIANWLKDYHTKVGIKKVDIVKLNEYFVKNKNVELLDNKDKEKLRKVLVFFENMKISSKENPMFEESFVAILPDGDVALVDSAGINKIDDKIKKLLNEVKGEYNLGNNTQLKELKDMLNKYPEGSLERRVVEEELGKLEDRSKK